MRSFLWYRGGGVVNPTTHTAWRSGQEVIVQIRSEVISRRGSAAQKLSVTNFLDIAQTTGDAAIAVGVEGIEVDGYTSIATRVDLGPIQNWVYATVNDLGSGGAVCVDEISTLVSLIITLDIALAAPSLMAASTAALIAAMVLVSLLGMISETLYFGLLPLMEAGSQTLA